MWLLNAETECLAQVPNERITPGQDNKPYAILSHRWLTDNSQEVSYSDIRSNTPPPPKKKSPSSSKLWPFNRKSTPPYTKKPGYPKLHLTTQQALRHNLKYVWIDTCCINKADEAETAEAIRSMYTW